MLPSPVIRNGSTYLPSNMDACKSKEGTWHLDKSRATLGKYVLKGSSNGCSSRLPATFPSRVFLKPLSFHPVNSEEH